MKIRRAAAADLKAVDELLSRVLEIHAKIRPDIFIPGTRKYRDEELLQIFEDDSRPVFVAVDSKDQVLGYCFCEIQERKGVVNMKDMKTLYIDDLCVYAHTKGQHVGQTLYNYVIDYAREIGCYNVTLHVWEGNDSARGFYEAMGFDIQKTLMEKVL